MLYLTRGFYIPQGFQQFTAKSIAGWRLMFIVLGVLSIVVGLFIIILMPDNQMSAKWLSDAEKAAAIQRVAVNQTGIKNTHFKWSHLKELALDIQIWLLAVLFILVRSCTSISS
jgi:sugar phosphate permease